MADALLDFKLSAELTGSRLAAVTALIGAYLAECGLDRDEQLVEYTIVLLQNRRTLRQVSDSLVELLDAEGGEAGGAISRGLVERLFGLLGEQQQQQQPPPPARSLFKQALASALPSPPPPPPLPSAPAAAAPEPVSSSSSSSAASRKMPLGRGAESASASAAGSGELIVIKRRRVGDVGEAAAAGHREEAAAESGAGAGDGDGGGGGDQGRVGFRGRGGFVRGFGRGGRGAQASGGFVPMYQVQQLLQQQQQQLMMAAVLATQQQQQFAPRGRGRGRGGAAVPFRGAPALRGGAAARGSRGGVRGGVRGGARGGARGGGVAGADGGSAGASYTNKKSIPCRFGEACFHIACEFGHPERAPIAKSAKFGGAAAPAAPTT